MGPGVGDSSFSSKAIAWTRQKDEAVQQGQRDWALLHAIKAGFEPENVACMLAQKELVDPMDPMPAPDVLSRYKHICACVKLVASLVGRDYEKLAVLCDVCE